MFPVITRIEDVLPAIAGRDDFIHVVKDGYQVIDYVFESTDSFDDPIRRECRGLKFDLDGNLIARPLHKFFNYGQKLITYDWSQPHQIMTKLDGSMVHGIVINNQVRLCTRMGITDQAMEAEKVLTNPNRQWLRYCAEIGVTPILEFTSPDNRIVIEYDKPQLTILAIRDIDSGEYYNRRQLEMQSNLSHLPLIDTHKITLGDDNIAEIREKTTGIEGYVVSWDDGTRVKIKTNEYTQMHRAVSYFDRENMILPVVLNGQCDDLYPALSEDRANELREYEASVMHEFIVYCDWVRDAYNRYFVEEWTRKDFALWVNVEVPQGIRAAYFAAIDDKDIEEAVKKCIIRNPDLLGTRWK